MIKTLFLFFFRNLFAWCVAMTRLKFQIIRTFLLLIFCGFVLMPVQAGDEVSVWAVASGERKIYHCPASRWYRVGDGKLIGECQARREGYEPALGYGCGSTCEVASQYQSHEF
jgi:hypothetical protein